MHAGFMMGAGGVALGVAGVVALVGGSSNFAWSLVGVASVLGVFAVAEALGLENWVKRSPGRHRLYLLCSSAILVAAVGAYLIWDTVALWWLAPLATLPVYLLLLWDPNERRQGGEDDFSGPLTPP